jgi:ATP-dependent DNA helicase DinG
VQFVGTRTTSDRSDVILLPMSLSDVFAPDGPLAKSAGSRYEVRDGQVRMAQAVAAKFAGGGCLFVEAPTGTGKSVAYLVPAIEQAAIGRTRTVVVTANIALQEQLITRDLPYLQAAFPEWSFTFALAKGIGNYLCLAKWQDAIAESLVLGGDDRDVWRMLEDWVGTTVNGDLSELATELQPRVRMAVTTTADECIGKKCDHYANCHGMEARRRIQSAQVVVTNYHLFFADLSIKAGEDDTAGILPAYSLVVLDEAQNAADIARDFFGWRVTMGMTRWAVRMLPERDRDRVATEAENFFRRVADGPGPKGERVKLRITKPAEVDGSALSNLLLTAADKLGAKKAIELVQADKAKLEKCETRARALAFQLAALDSLAASDNCVYFGERPPNPKGYWSVGMKAIDVASILENALFGSKVIRSIVATSATLTTAGKFDFILGQLGAYDADELIVPSPFDHNGAAVLVVPRDLPDPKHAMFAEVVAEVVDQTVRAARGRTLALFTSYRVLDVAYQYLMQQRDLPYRILKQGDMPRTKLIDEFRRDVSSVLLGTTSFWEGIDVQGESLSAVVIDRLPFEHPDDPVFEAICERNPRGWFMQYSLPKSIIEFRQGFGRLIRSRTDRGAIVVCDRRIVDKPYGVKYVRSLPEGVRLHRSLDVVAQMLGGTT